MEIRKFSFITSSLFLLLTVVCWQVGQVVGFFGGAWCPYKTDKLVPCRVHNGTESYLGPNICWKNFNGSFACTKRMLVRPKFVTTYKRVSETIYKCCPGLYGKTCHQECFNCSTIRLLENRLGYLETKINQIQVLSPPPSSSSSSRRLDVDDKTFGSGHKDDVKNSISDDDDDQDLDTLNIINDLRGLETRLVNVESQLAKLIHSVNEFLKLNHKTDSSIVYQQQSEDKAKEHSQVPIITTEKSTTTSSTTTTTTNTPVTPPVDRQTIISRELDGHYRHNHHQHRHHHHHQTAIRLLESNLERGDIASTLNDDGEDEEVILSASTEDYTDQLYAHEYRS